MSIISERISKAKFVGKMPPAPRIDPNMPAMTGRQLIRWLKARGAKPIEPELKKRLIASGNWGMPDE